MIEKIYDEGGINWSWYTMLQLHDNKTVTILKHWRLHKFNPDQGSESHPANAETNIGQVWRETNDRTATHYNIPLLGWHEITNPKYIFDYNK